MKLYDRHYYETIRTLSVKRDTLLDVNDIIDLVQSSKDRADTFVIENGNYDSLTVKMLRKRSKHEVLSVVVEEVSKEIDSHII